MTKNRVETAADDESNKHGRVRESTRYTKEHVVVIHLGTIFSTIK